MRWFDRVKETTTTTGTGTLTLAGAVADFRAFSSVYNDGESVQYAIDDTTNNAWEMGIGIFTLSGTTLSRVTVRSSSNSGALVSFGSGTKNVYVDISGAAFACRTTRGFDLASNRGALGN